MLLNVAGIVDCLVGATLYWIIAVDISVTIIIIIGIIIATCHEVFCCFVMSLSVSNPSSMVAQRAQHTTT